MRSIFIVAALFATSTVQAQRVISVDGRAKHACDGITEGQPYNPYADLFRNYCYASDDRYKQAVARNYGRPEPSIAVLSAPEHGSPDAKLYGMLNAVIFSDVSERPYIKRYIVPRRPGGEVALCKEYIRSGNS